MPGTRPMHRDVVQAVTAGVLVWALYRPLSRRSLFPRWQPDVAWRLPSLQGAFNFVAYAGPICGVLITKVIVYGARHAPRPLCNLPCLSECSVHVVLRGWHFAC